MDLKTTNYLEESQKRWKLLLTGLKISKICVYEVDLVNQLYTAFENSEAVFGVTEDVILRDVQPFSKLSPEEYQLAVSEYFSHPDDKEIIARAFEAVLSGKQFTYEARMKAGGSKFIWCKIEVAPIMENGVPVRMVGVIMNISDIREKNDILERQVNMDLFTGLYHKQASIKMIEQLLINQKDRIHSVILIDIDKFKDFNDTYGHFEGDKVIKTLANLIKDNIKTSNIFGRFGGDEFIILTTDILDEKVIYEILEPLISFEVEGKTVTTSIGVAVFPKDGNTFEELFKKADVALYKAKATRGTMVYYTDDSVL